MLKAVGRVIDPLERRASGISAKGLDDFQVVGRLGPSSQLSNAQKVPGSGNDARFPTRMSSVASWPETVELLLMVRPAPCSASTGVVLADDPPHHGFYAVPTLFAKLQQ